MTPLITRAGIAGSHIEHSLGAYRYHAIQKYLCLRPNTVTSLEKERQKVKRKDLTITWLSGLASLCFSAPFPTAFKIFGTDLLLICLR